MPALRFHISGRVQGVFFRAEAKRKADELGLTGWVRNTDDGGVEVHAEGDNEKLHVLKEWCRKGPPNAEVQEMQEQEIPEKGYSSFDIHR